MKAFNLPPINNCDINQILSFNFLSALEVLNFYNIDCRGKDAVVLGNSYSTGAPISMLLQKKEARVLVCDKSTNNIPELVRRADILVCATG